MTGLPSKLNHVPDLKHSIYADDITLRVHKGSDAHIEETLQTTVTILVHIRGLACSSHKFELLVLRGLIVKHDAHTQPSRILVLASGYTIPEVSKLGILGLLVQNTGRNSENTARTRE